MKVVILCGGKGTRIRGIDDDVPKPLIPIGKYPVLWHIMNTYMHYGHNEFILCLGYKGIAIKTYFLNYQTMVSDFTSDYGNDGKIEFDNSNIEIDWKITHAETGVESLTGSRVKKIEKYISEDETFLLTYGDGVSDININELISFHHDKAKIMTVSGVRPPSRFGELNYDQNSIITEFNEKPQATEGRISGGFFVCQREIFNYLDSERDNEILETAPMQNIASDKQMVMYPHDGFWQCMDTYRDYKLLNELYENKAAPWVVWD